MSAFEKSFKEAKKLEKLGRETLWRMPKSRPPYDISPGAAPCIVMAILLLALLNECTRILH